MENSLASIRIDLKVTDVVHSSQFTHLFRLAAVHGKSPQRDAAIRLVSIAEELAVGGPMEIYVRAQAS